MIINIPFWFRCLAGLLLATQISLGQTILVEGQITDRKTGEPLPFASVGVRNTFVGTSSNSQGGFLLKIPTNYRDSTLMVSYMGYKSFNIPVRNIKSPIRIGLEQDAITLSEVKVRPWQPWDYIWNAMQKIPKNYPQEAFMTQSYYSEYISENDVFLKYSEGVVETYNPPYGSKDKSQSRVLKARSGDGLGELQFMRGRIDKQMAKEARKERKRGVEASENDSIDEMIRNASFGGPEEMLSGDPLRDTASYLNLKHRKKYDYFIEGYTRYEGESIIIIGFESKGVYEMQRQEGKVYISLDSDAIVSIVYNSEFVIPGIAKPVILAFGFGITNPLLHAGIRYRRINNRWYLADLYFDGSTRLTDIKMFKKNQKSFFRIEMNLVTNQFDFENVHEIPEDERIDKDKPLEKQVDPDPEFWKTYRVSRPVKLNQ